MTPLDIDREAPRVLPAAPLPGQERESRPLYVLCRPIRFTGRVHGAMTVTVPAGYVTDFASIPRLAALRIRPLDRHAFAAVLHDFLYSVGEPDRRWIADDLFLERMALDGVHPLRRALMHKAVRLGGQGGYARARDWWAESFADPETGELTLPPFDRESAFMGEQHGIRASGSPEKWRS